MTRWHKPKEITKKAEMKLCRAFGHNLKTMYTPIPNNNIQQYNTQPTGYLYVGSEVLKAEIMKTSIF
jgi:hypothetical protein